MEWDMESCILRLTSSGIRNSGIQEFRTKCAVILFLILFLKKSFERITKQIIAVQHKQKQQELHLIDV